MVAPLVSDIPSILEHFELHKWQGDEQIAVAYRNLGYVHAFIHFGDNLYSHMVVEHIRHLCSENNNGVNTNYVVFYSPMLPGIDFLVLEEEFNNFVYYHQPYIAFGQIPYLINVNTLPPINLRHTKNYLCLANRSTTERRQVFDSLAEKNLLDRGFVSFRNGVIKHVVHEDDKQHLLSEPYINFEDPQYGLVPGGHSRKYVWFYPIEGFLFDFSIETFFEEVPLLTEKSTRAFFWGKIPVSTSSRNVMHYIEQFGFDIFRDVVDYKYDIQKDKDLRMELFLQEIHKLATMDINTISNLEIRLESNRRLMCDLVERGKTTLENIKLNIAYTAENRDKFLGY